MTPAPRTPNLFLIGAAKAATTSLYSFLGNQSDVFLSAHKEPHFFASFAVPPRRERFFRIVRSANAYRRLFAAARAERYVGEGSTSYLTDSHAPLRIARSCADARAIAVLRNPIDRCHSHYLNDVREGVERRTFEQALDEFVAGAEEQWPAHYFTMSRYAAGIARWKRQFGSRLLVLLYDELVTDAPRAVSELGSFLDLDPLGGSRTLPHENGFKVPRNDAARYLLGTPATRNAGRLLVPKPARQHVRSVLLQDAPKPALTPELRARLRELFADDVEHLRGELAASLPWHDFSQGGHGG